MFPEGTLPIGHLKEILRGGHDKVTEAGAAMAGGHTVDDKEPKYGLSVAGTVHPDRILRNAGARPGDVLILTRPIGTGVLFNACRSGKLSFAELEPLLHTVAALNGPALEAVLEFDIHACTDITGFGLAGHIMEMVLASNVSVGLLFDSIPLYPHAVEMYRRGETTRSNSLNRELLEGRYDVTVSLRREQEELLVDPQTSGGLLLALPESQADGAVSALRAAGVADASIIGEVSEGEPLIAVR
jgi:selenide,water dikinase